MPIAPVALTRYSTSMISDVRLEKFTPARVVRKVCAWAEMIERIIAIERMYFILNFLRKIKKFFNVPNGLPDLARLVNLMIGPPSSYSINKLENFKTFTAGVLLRLLNKILCVRF